MLNSLCHKSTRQQKRKFDPSLLLPPIHYYSRQFKIINTKNEWARVHCCFHSPDNNPSLSINLAHGCFICHACQVKGGDIIDFHQLRYKTNFIETINYLGAWVYE